jgi:hypothetical protein
LTTTTTTSTSTSTVGMLYIIYCCASYVKIRANFCYIASTSSVTLGNNATGTTPATVSSSPATVPTNAANQIAFDTSLMGLVMICILGLYLL